MNIAATYRAVGDKVWMKDTEGFDNHIQTCRTAEAALKAAEKWQKKENAAVAKANKKVAK